MNSPGRPDVKGVRYRAEQFLEDKEHPVLGAIKDDALAMADYIEYLEGTLVAIGVKVDAIYDRMMEEAESAGV